MGIFTKIFGSKNERELKGYQPLIDRINGMREQYEAKSDAELQGCTADFRQRLDNGESLDDLLPEAFAVTREAAWRVLGMRHFDVQLKGGMVLHNGKIAEMRTGEGKTLTATLPTYLNALAKKGVHVVTVNDYLARRDAEWMGQVYNFMQLETGIVVHGISDIERQRSYMADITYGQNNEFGFDYLRDNMKQSPDRMVQQRGLNYAIIDEVDSILIDEARTPLIISGPAEQSAGLYQEVDRVVPRLKRDIHYTVDEKAHSTMLTDSGVERVQELLDLDNLYDPKHIAYLHRIGNALKAHTLYKRDVKYTVQDSKILIIDEHTGRLMPGRRWSDGLHQAIEAKEGVEIEEENQTLATVTFQNFFRMYDKLSGMTGTADTEAAEFHQIYKLDVVVVPTNKPMVRDDQADLVYKNEMGKFKAVIGDILDTHAKGQPVLVGTVSVEKSEVLSSILRKKNVKFDVLNAKNHAREASIVAQAGRKGSITISTSMAGRGTDIVLGGNAEVMAQDALDEEIAQAIKKGGKDAHPYREDLSKQAERLAELTTQYQEQCDAEKAEVLELGGLRIVGTERHESRRIDNQLRGRAGRQGDPGSSRFYLSFQDDLMRIFGTDRMMGLMERLGMEDDVPIEHKWVTRSIENAQKKVESHNFDSRKNILEYDDVMNQQRKTIYGLRQQILEGRYAPELSEDDKKAGKVAKAPTTSGDWTIPKLKEEAKESVEVMVNGILDGYAEQVADDVEIDQPAWRVLRHEIWRQTGALCDIEKRVDKADATGDRSALIDSVCEQVAASQVQQRERLYDLADGLIGDLIANFCPAKAQEDQWDIEGLGESLHEAFGFDFELPQHGLGQQELADTAWQKVEKRIDEREDELGRPFLLYFCRHFYLEDIDTLWIEHLKTMDHLREGIHLRGYGQKDPKKEYKKEGFELFGEMMQNVSANVARNIFHVRIERDDDEEIPELRSKERRMHASHAGTSATDESTVYGDAADGGKKDTKQKTVRRAEPKVGRNDPCPCGSGKKYKKCHGRVAA